MTSVAFEVEGFAPSKPDGSTSPHGLGKSSAEGRGVSRPHPIPGCARQHLWSSPSEAASLLKVPVQEPWGGGEGRRGTSARTSLNVQLQRACESWVEFSVNYRFASHLCSHADCARRGPSGRTRYLSFHAQMN